MLLETKLEVCWVSTCRSRSEHEMGSGSEHEMGAPRGRKVPQVGVCTQAQSKHFTPRL